MKQSNNQIMHNVYGNPKYAGKHIVAIGGKIFVANTGEEATKIFAEQTKKYPKETPLSTYVPSADSLIL